MRRLLLICVALAVAGLCMLKPWAKQERKAPLQVSSGFYGSPMPTLPIGDPDFPLQKELARMMEEDSAPVEVIDLSQLPFQKTEPVLLPELPPEFLSALTVKPCAEEVPPGPTPVVPAFLPLAADRDSVEPPIAAPAAWVQVVRLIWALPAPQAPLSEPDQYEPVPFMPAKSAYHRDHPECPYVGPRPEAGSHAHSNGKSGGDEAQDAPVQKNPAKRSTTDIRPGELPTGWLWKPF